MSYRDIPVAEFLQIKGLCSLVMFISEELQSWLANLSPLSADWPFHSSLQIASPVFGKPVF